MAAGSGELHATLGDDELAIDNEVVLVSPRRRPLRVQLSVADTGKAATNLRTLLVRAFEACGQAVLVDSRAGSGRHRSRAAASRPMPGNCRFSADPTR